MPFIVRNLKLAPGEDEQNLLEEVLARFGLRRNEVASWRIVRKAVDARQKKRITFVYTVQIQVSDEAEFFEKFGSNPDVEAVAEASIPVFPTIRASARIVIAGFGPAGMFAGLRLAEYGLSPVILERGRAMEERVRDVANFWSSGSLDCESNVQFGEGGAGTFSDGKLTTRVRDPNIGYILARLVQFGAPEDILYLAKPHIGTDRLRTVVVNLRRHLMAKGVDVRFGHRLADIAVTRNGISSILVNDREEPCDILVVAPGHSARDTYSLLHERGVRLLQKPFSIGVRVEHPQELINSIQYGKAANPHLPPAEYAVVYNVPQTGRSVYSFCMCPGGMVVAGSSEAGGVVTNGMSNYLRNAPSANSALVVTVGGADFSGDSPLAGVEFQRRWERAAFEAGGGSFRAPAQNMMSFLGQKGGMPLRSSYRPGVVAADLSMVLPRFVSDSLREGLVQFDRKMRGFVTGEATLTGVETRTSSPVRIERGEDLQSVSTPGLYPAGEGAGYAGGIMSAALDGIRVADAIASRLGSDV